MMKKIIFLFLAALTYYIAGMYQYFPLMVLFMAEFIFFFAMLFLTWYFKQNLSAVFVRESECIDKGTEGCYDIRIRNKGKLPVSQFRIRMRFRYKEDKTGIVKYVYGGSECGDSILQFDIGVQYCGMIQVEMLRLQVYDYLALFSSKKCLDKKMMIAVLPEEWALSIEFYPFGISQTYPFQEQVISYMGEPYHEIRQIREYQESDSNRHIHWNQSARTDKIWIKEYEKETDVRTELFLNTSGFETAEPMVLDGFYKLLSALVLGFLRSLPMIRVYWYDGQQRTLISMDISDNEQNRELLLQLYQLDFNEQNDKEMEAELQQQITKNRFAFQLNLDLCWYRGEQLIYQFSQEELNQDLTKKTFHLS